MKDTRQPHIIDEGRSLPTQEKQTTAWELPDSNAEVQAKGANKVARVVEGGEQDPTEPALRVTEDDRTPLQRESEYNLEEPPGRNSFEAAEVDELNPQGSQSGGYSSITALSVCLPCLYLNLGLIIRRLTVKLIEIVTSIRQWEIRVSSKLDAFSGDCSRRWLTCEVRRQRLYAQACTNLSKRTGERIMRIGKEVSSRRHFPK